MTSPDPRAWRSAPVVLWTLGLTGLVLAPLARPGYVLLRDMVATPRQYLLDESWGAGQALPRAVPVDAVVALASTVVDGGVVQRVALVAALVLAGLGGARLAGGDVWVSLGASTLMVWNPYVAERLLMGHWTLLLGYACLPWVAAACLDLRAGHGSAGWSVVAWTSLAALSPGGGLLVLMIAIPLLSWPGSAVTSRQRVALLGAWLLLSVPWWLPGLLHPSAGRSDRDGVAAFAAQSDTSLGSLGSLLGLGGIWNGDAVPASRGALPAAVWTIVALVLVVIGVPELRRRWGGGAFALMSAAALGVLLSGWGSWAPASLEWFVGSVPGGGLLRDGQRLLAPLALLVAAAAPWGARAAARRLGTPSAPVVLGLVVAVAPITVMVDLAGGAWGRLEPVRYPAAWEEVRAYLAQHPGTGSVASLPWQPLRQFAWNDRRPVLDPAPRYLPVPVLTATDLAVRTGDGLVVVDGEDLRAAAVGAALRSGEPAAATLPPLGVGWVLVARDSAGEVPDALLVGADRVVSSPGLELWRLPLPPTDASSGRQPYAGLLAAANLAAAALALTSWLVLALRRLPPASLRNRSSQPGRKAA